MNNKKEMEMQIHGRRLPHCPMPRSVHEAKAKINNATNDIEKTLEDWVFRMGTWFTVVQQKLPYGQFTKWVPENTRFKYRSAKNYMDYATECRLGGRMKPYHPNPKTGIKPNTLALLESGEDSSATVAEVGKQKVNTRPPQAENLREALSADQKVALIVEYVDRLTAVDSPEELSQFEPRLTEGLLNYFRTRRGEWEE